MNKNIEAIINRVEKDWICEEGLVTLRPAKEYDCLNGNYNGDENQILWTAHYLLLLNLSLGERAPVIYLYGFHDAIDRLEVSVGLHNRHIGLTSDGISWDEQHALCVISQVCVFNIAKDICDHGLRNGWIFNNTGDPAWDLRQQRQGKEIAWYKLSAGYKVEIWYMAWFLISILMTSLRSPTETSGRLMAWQKLVLLMRRGGLWVIAYRIFMWKLKRDYGEKPLTKMYGIYFNINETQERHPLLDLIQEYENATY